MPVNSQHRDYAAALDRWQRCRDCYDGSDAVKGRGVKYLPALDSHREGQAEKYAEYRLRALFYNATGRTVNGMAGAIFQKDPEYKGPQDLLDQMEEDITLTGVPADLFGLLVAQEVLKVGRCGVLVDMPEEGGEQPYWCLYRAEDIPNWSTIRQDGEEQLTMVVLQEQYEEDNQKDRYVPLRGTQYRVLELVDGAYQQSVWRQEREGSDKWIQHGDDIVPLMRGQPLDYIPFVFIGPTTITAEVAVPPLLDLVEVNLSHYRTMADLEHGRHLVALPTPWISGGVGNDKSGKQMLGPSVLIKLEKGGQAGMLEFTGAGLGALVTADQDKRKMMATLGARLLEDQAVTQETATAVTMRHSGDHASLRTVANSVGEGLTICMRWHAAWLGRDDDVIYGPNKDFFNVRMTPQEMQSLLAMLQAEKISYKTFYFNLTNGQITRPGVDDEEEQKQIEQEAPEPLENPIGGGEEMLGAEEGDQVVVAGNPYRIVKRRGKFVVIKAADGKVVGTHPTREAAQKHLAALHANVEE